MLRTDSEMIDAFVAGLARGDSARAEELHRASENAPTPYDEKDLLKRTVTAAARAGSRFVGEEPRRNLVENGDQAYAEYFRFRPMVAPNDQEIMRQLIELLGQASDQMDAIAGGGIGQIRDPNERPAIVEGHDPTREQRLTLARQAGLVVGTIASTGKVDSLAELRGVIDGCPSCGAVVKDFGPTHRQIAPDEGPPIETAQCTLDEDHRLEREHGSDGPWRKVGSRQAWARN